MLYLDYLGSHVLSCNYYNLQKNKSATYLSQSHVLISCDLEVQCDWQVFRSSRVKSVLSDLSNLVSAIFMNPHAFSQMLNQMYVSWCASTPLHHTTLYITVYLLAKNFADIIKLCSFKITQEKKKTNVSSVWVSYLEINNIDLCCVAGADLDPVCSVPVLCEGHHWGYSEG